MKRSETMGFTLVAIVFVGFQVLSIKYTIYMPVEARLGKEIYDPNLFFVTMGVLLILELACAWLLTKLLEKNNMVWAILVTFSVNSEVLYWWSAEPLIIETWAIFVLLLPLLYLYIWISYGVREIIRKSEQGASTA